MMSRRIPIFLFFVLLFSQVLGCASIRAASAERNARDRAVRAYLHTSPNDTLMATSRKILFEQGFEVNDSTDTVLQTAWIADRDGESRYLVTITEVKAGQKRVEMTQNFVSETNQRSTLRDLEMEYELIKRVAPRGAAKIDADARAAGQAAAR